MNNSKDTWKGIKQIISTKRKNACSFPTTINLANQNITDTQKITDVFNKYFANIGNNLASAIPKSNVSFESFFRNSPVNSFALFPTTKTKIENIIDNLNTSKSSGPYSILTKLRAEWTLGHSQRDDILATCTCLLGSNHKKSHKYEFLT